MDSASTARLVIPSRLQLVDLVHAAAEKMADLCGFSAEEALDFGLAVREVAINAIRHGNRERADLDVRVDLVFGDDGIRAKVQDRGEGFDPESAPDPTTEENLLATSGRGLLLVRAFVDDVRFRYRRGHGMTVTLFKHKPRENE